ncbi:transposase [Candidatus Megaera polyxenophila]|uniref:transposase n=1 Tax=Candidatus Megaera polyxenophila TaxID=988779 RepID=UPI003977DE9B
MSKSDQEKIKQAVDLLIDKDTDLTSFFAKDGMLKELTKNLFERALKAEMDEHLGYSRYGRGETENSRNGSMPIQNWGEAMAHFLIKFEGRI